MSQSALPTTRGGRGIARSRKIAANATAHREPVADRRSRARQPWLWSSARPGSRSVHLAQQIACRSGALVILVVGTVGVLLGSHHGGRHVSQSGRLTAQRLTAQVATHSSPVDAPPPVTTTGTAAAGSAGAVDTSAGSAGAVAAAIPAAPAPAVAAPPKGVARETIASWYGDRPVECWEGGEPRAFPVGLKMWAASRTLPCGATIEVIGPAGTVVLPVEDRGPYLHPGRDLDLSTVAFHRVAGPLAKGLVRVQYRLDPGEALSQ